MIQFIQDNTFIILIAFLLLMGLFLLLLRKKDAQTNYDEVDLNGKIAKDLNGATLLFFKYDRFTEPKKKKFILNKYKPGLEIENEHGHPYIIIELNSSNYYEKGIDSNGNIIDKSGPYVTYNIKPKSELPPTPINIENSQGVQVNTAEQATQIMQNNDFGNIETLIEYKQILVDNNISEDDIDLVINNPTKENKKNFIEKYGKTITDTVSALTGILNFLKK